MRLTAGAISEEHGAIMAANLDISRSSLSCKHHRQNLTLQAANLVYNVLYHSAACSLISNSAKYTI